MSNLSPELRKDAVKIVIDLARWSKEFPAERGVPSHRKKECDEQLALLETRARVFYQKIINFKKENGNVDRERHRSSD